MRGNETVVHRSWHIVVAVLLAALCPLHADIAIAGEYPKQISITIDDVDINGRDTPTLSLDEQNEAIIHALSRAKLQAAIFVCGMRVDNDAGRRHLLALSQQGHIIGNHTYSHFEYSSVGFETFSKDVLRGEDVIRGYAGFRKLLRFPYLKEGDTVQERDQMRAFMKEHGYANGYVTIDASDWAIDARLRKRLRENPHADTQKYRDFYIEHIAARAEYYDELARSVLHRPIKHTLLIHHNLLAALFLNDLIDGLKGRGWKFINADEAYRDPVSRELPHSIPAGEALVYALAKDSGRFEGKLRYPAEDGRYEDKRMDELGL